MTLGVRETTDASGLARDRLDLALELVREKVEGGTVPAAAAAVAQHGRMASAAAFGRRGPEADAPEVQIDSIFLLASLTKPIVCSGVILLVQDGQLALDQPVAEIVPEFGGQGKERVMVRHLLTHTSGLPDQLESNIALRERHAPLSDFVDAVCRLSLLFEPGTRVSYQSMGILMLQTIVERITGQRLRDWLRRSLFEPLGMADTTLGIPSSGMSRTVLATPSGDANYGDAQVDWGWNSSYWRDLGAPWGGLHSTIADLTCFLSHVSCSTPGPLTLSARRAMIQDHIARMPGVGPEDKLAHRWGLGWMLGSPSFGQLVSPRTFGHTGATGTLFWADPESGLTCVLLTNQPDRSQFLFQRFSNAVASSLQS